MVPRILLEHLLCARCHEITKMPRIGPLSLRVFDSVAGDVRIKVTMLSFRVAWLLVGF